MALKKEKEKVQLQLSMVETNLSEYTEKYNETKKSLEKCTCHKLPNKTLVAKVSQTEQDYDATNEEIMTLKVKIDMLEKDKKSIVENNDKFNQLLTKLLKNKSNSLL